jgi:hypothetical protein
VHFHFSRHSPDDPHWLHASPNMGVLGKEAVAAMTAIEAQQQSLTLQWLIALVQYMLCLSIMNWVNWFPCLLWTLIIVSHNTCWLGLKVESERSYHQRVLQILDQLERDALMALHCIPTTLVLKKTTSFTKSGLCAILIKCSYFADGIWATKNRSTSSVCWEFHATGKDWGRRV